ncbi:hypothetical protein [Pseudomonas sp. TH10]|uniref:hypothetical protein n=1 Tax=Pseudomonas sp. TH10 TaxID=2796376 RepID=UPI0019145453|nr:hypothetical protein [Pseudomonas sp. TH10]MBK5516552.1 hypothetical protein [Pseudomonas sp. TH10]
MLFSEIFHPECDPIRPHDAPNHVVFNCLQWKTPSLEVMPQAAKQRFAVICGDYLNPYVTAALERAYILGAMSAVKLIAVHEDSLYLFLDSGVSSATFQKIESLWLQVMCMSHIRLTVDFANVNEVYSGHSDYVFWEDAKEILESNDLGIEPYDLKALDDFSDKVFTDEDLSFFQSQEEGQPAAIQHCQVEILNFAKIMGHTNRLMSLHYLYLINPKSDA